VSDLPPLPWLDASAALQVLRIVQEVLTNVLKHAGAHTVTLRTAVRRDEAGHDWVRVTIEDDGRGFDPAAAQAAGKGRGLRNLRGRAESLRGRLELDSGPGGTAVRLDLPLAAATP
jgi:signal transduction histidine kinase